MKFKNIPQKNKKNCTYKTLRTHVQGVSNDFFAVFTD